MRRELSALSASPTSGNSLSRPFARHVHAGMTDAPNECNLASSPIQA
jgi:hypothetical protein